MRKKRFRIDASEVIQQLRIFKNLGETGAPNVDYLELMIPYLNEC